MISKTTSDPVSQFHKVLKDTKRDTLISVGEDSKIVEAAERAIEFAVQQGDSAARNEVLRQLEHLTGLNPLYIEPNARDAIKLALSRLSLGGTVASKTEELFGPPPAQSRRTYIMSTIGYTSQSKAVLEDMFRGGMNIVRLNMAHFGPHTAEYVKNAREAAADVGVPMRISADLGGPKIRLGQWDKATIGAQVLQVGDKVELKLDTTDGKLPASKNLLPIEDKALIDSVAIGHRLLMVDGKIELKITGKTADSIQTEVVRGGEVAPGKGIAMPDSRYSGPTLTAEDKEALAWCCKNGIEIVAISFCSTAADIEEARSIAAANGRPDMKFIAKIENQIGLDNLGDIARESDGMMVARGDLALEIGAAHVPAAQEAINRAGSLFGKPVIVATQVLESMTTGTAPLRAETDGIYHALEQGAECMMTAKETTRGDNPAHVVRTLNDLLVEQEKILQRAPLALRISSKKVPQGNDVTGRLSERGAQVTGRVGGQIHRSEDGKEWLAVKVDGSDLYFEVTGADAGYQRFSRDEYLEVFSATFDIGKEPQVAHLTLVKEETGKSSKKMVEVGGTVFVHKWTT